MHRFIPLGRTTFPTVGSTFPRFGSNFRFAAACGAACLLLFHGAPPLSAQPAAQAAAQAEAGDDPADGKGKADAPEHEKPSAEELQAKAALARQVRDLIEQLDAPEASERAAAEAKLVELGPPILDLLPSPERYTGQVKASLSAIAKKVQAAAGREATIGRRVTLNAEDLTVEAALKQLAERSGDKLDFAGLEGKPPLQALAKLNFTDVPWWSAMDQLLDRAQLTVDPYSSGDRAVLSPRPPSAALRYGSAAYFEAFRFDARKISLERRLTATVPAVCRLDLGVEWEPRMHPVVLELQKEGFTAEDDAGRKVAFGMEGGDLEMVVPGGQMGMEIPTVWNAPDRSARELRKLHGRFKAIVPGLPFDFAFTEFNKKDVSQTKGDVRVQLEEVRRVEADGTVWEFRVRVYFQNAHGALQSHRQWILNNVVKLLDSAGAPLELGLMETTHRTEDSVGMAYFFDLPKGPGGHKLVYRTPVLITEQVLDFELKSIPLP